MRNGVSFTLSFGDRRRLQLVISNPKSPQLENYPQVRKIVGDGNGQEAFKAILDAFNMQPIDMVYIDAAHLLMPTFTSFALYSMALRPKFIVFDDIDLSEPMRKDWRLIKSCVPEGEAVNADGIIPDIRPTRDGFGVGRLSQNIASDTKAPSQGHGVVA